MLLVFQMAEIAAVLGRGGRTFEAIFHCLKMPIPNVSCSL